MDTRRVDYEAPIGPPLLPCCATCRAYAAIPAVRVLEGGGTELGYAMEPGPCGCPSRWIPHNWDRSRGGNHLRFEQAP